MKLATHKQSGTILMAVIMLLLLIPVTVLLVFDTTSAASSKIDSDITEMRIDAVLQAALAHARFQADTNTSCANFSSLPLTQFSNHTYQVTTVQDLVHPYLLHLTANIQLDSGAVATRQSTHYAYQAAVSGERRPEFDLSAMSANPGQSFATSNTLTISNDGIDKSYSLLNFELYSAIPPEARIHSAVLETTVKSVTVTTYVPPSTWLTAHPISRRWTADANWDSHDGNKSWRPLGQSEPLFAATAIAEISGLPGDTLSFDLTDMIRYWSQSRTTFSGVLLKSSNALSLLELYSKEYSDYDAQPKLIVNYSCPCGQTCDIQPRRNYLDSLKAETDAVTSLRTCNASRDYRGTDGDIRWTFDPWMEDGDDGDPCTGGMGLDQDPTVADSSEWQFKFSGDNQALERHAWLEFAEQVVVSFRYRRHALSNANQKITLKAANGGGWTTLLTIDGGASDSEYQTASVVLPNALVGRDTTFRFEAQNYNAIQFIYLDDFSISFEGPVNPPLALNISADTTLNEDKPGNSFASDNPMKLKNDDNKNLRQIYKVNTDGLIPSEIVARASLRLWIEDNRTDQDATFSLYALTENWHGTQVTWNDREKSISAWSIPGGTYSVPSNSNDTPTLIVAKGTKNVWLDFDITTLVQSWSDFPSTNHGLILIMDDGANGKEVKITSTEEGDSTVRPHVDLLL